MLVRQAFLPPEALSDSRTIGAAAQQAIDAARRGDIARGLAIALQAREQARGLELEGGELAALNAAANVHAIRGDPVAAAAAAIDAHALARRLGDRAMMGHALATLSSSALAFGTPQDARVPLERALGQAIADDQPALEIRLRVALGVALGDLGDFDAAANEFVAALDLTRRTKDSTSTAALLANLGNLHCKRAVPLRERGDAAGARLEGIQGEVFARRALEAAAAETNALVRVDANAVLGRCRSLQGDDRGAIEHYERAAADARTSRCRTRTPWFLLELGRLRLAAGECAEARAACEEALRAASEIRPSSKVAAACAALAQVERRLGDELGARRWEVRARSESAEFDRLRSDVRAQLRTFFTA